MRFSSVFGSFFRARHLFFCAILSFMCDYWCDCAISVRSCAAKLIAPKFEEPRKIFWPDFGNFRPNPLDNFPNFGSGMSDFHHINQVSCASFASE